MADEHDILSRHCCYGITKVQHWRRILARRDVTGSYISAVDRRAAGRHAITRHNGELPEMMTLRRSQHDGYIGVYATFHLDTIIGYELGLRICYRH